MQLLLSLLVGKIMAISVGLYYFRYLTRPYRLLLLTVILAAIAESLGRYIALSLHQHNSWMFNFYLAIDFFLNGIIAISLVANKNTKKIFVALMTIYFLFWIIELCINSIYMLANFSIVAGAIVLTITYFFVLFDNSIFSNRGIIKQPVFWLSIATILYCAASIPYWGLHNYLISNAPKLSLQLMTINVVLDIIRHPLAAVSFILLGQQKKAVLNTV